MCRATLAQAIAIGAKRGRVFPDELLPTSTKQLMPPPSRCFPTLSRSVVMATLPITTVNHITSIVVAFLLVQAR